MPQIEGNMGKIEEEMEYRTKKLEESNSNFRI